MVENRTLNGWRQLEKEYPEQMRELKEFLKKYPSNIRVTSGKAKKLKGILKDYYQYDVTYSYRVRYQIDTKERIVLVAYAGQHP